MRGHDSSTRDTGHQAPGSSRRSPARPLVTWTGKPAHTKPVHGGRLAHTKPAPSTVATHVPAAQGKTANSSVPSGIAYVCPAATSTPGLGERGSCQGWVLMLASPLPRLQVISGGTQLVPAVHRGLVRRSDVVVRAGVVAGLHRADCIVRVDRGLVPVGQARALIGCPWSGRTTGRGCSVRWSRPPGASPPPWIGPPRPRTGRRCPRSLGPELWLRAAYCPGRCRLHRWPVPRERTATYQTAWCSSRTQVRCSGTRERRSAGSATR